MMNVEDTSHSSPNAGQFVSMGSVLDINRMARSCVELLTEHLRLTIDQASSILAMDRGTVTSLKSNERAAQLTTIPAKSLPQIERLCAIQSMLLSCYTVKSMVSWFHANIPGLAEAPISILIRDGNNGLPKILQAAIGKASS